MGRLRGEPTGEIGRTIQVDRRAPDPFQALADSLEFLGDVAKATGKDPLGDGPLEVTQDDSSSSAFLSALSRTSFPRTETSSAAASAAATPFANSQIRNAQRLVEAGEPSSQVARDLGMSRATLYRQVAALPTARPTPLSPWVPSCPYG